MALASFGNKVFTVGSNKIYTFKDFNRTYGLETKQTEYWSDNQVNGTEKPENDVKNPQIETVNITVVLDSAAGINVENERKEWRDICYAAKPYLFIIGGNPISPNPFFLKNVTESSPVFNSVGKLLCITLSLSFEETVDDRSVVKETNEEKLQYVDLTKVDKTIKDAEKRQLKDNPQPSSDPRKKDLKKSWAYAYDTGLNPQQIKDLGKHVLNYHLDLHKWCLYVCENAHIAYDFVSVYVTYQDYIDKVIAKDHINSTSDDRNEFMQITKPYMFSR